MKRWIPLILSSCLLLSGCKDDLSLKDFDLFRSWIENSVPLLPHDAYLVEEQNGFISLAWLETLPDSEKLVIDFLDNCVNFKFE